MTPVRPSRIEAALLFDEFQPFAYADFAQRLELVFGDKVSVKLGAHEDGVWGILDVGGHFVKLSQNLNPLGPEGFQPVLNSPATKMRVPEAGQLVSGHRQNIFITVGDNDVLTPDIDTSTFGEEFAQIVSDTFNTSETPSLEKFENRVFLTRLMVSQLIAMNKPTIVHWCQSDQLMRPEEFELTHDPRGMTVQLHPSFFSSGTRENGVPRVGFHCFGSEHICGHHMVVNETSAPATVAVEAAEDLAYYYCKTGATPASDIVMQFKSGTDVRIRKTEDTNAFPRPYLSLDIVKVGAPRGTRIFDFAKLANKQTHKNNPKTTNTNAAPTKADKALGLNQSDAKPEQSIGQWIDGMLEGAKSPFGRIKLLLGALVAYLVLSELFSSSSSTISALSGQ